MEYFFALNLPYKVLYITVKTLQSGKGGMRVEKHICQVPYLAQDHTLNAMFSVVHERMQWFNV